MLTLTASQRRALRARAHALHPVAAVGHNGLSASVIAEIDRCLTAHELIKVRVFSKDRADRETLLAAICEAVDAAPVQHVGNILVVFRELPPPAPADKPSPNTTPPPRRQAKRPIKATSKPALNPRRRLAGRSR
jgi:putative YhbY family RNA-binding protein